jgi:hypothetical protein
MTTPYSPQAWANGSAGGTPLSGSRLTHAEAGIFGAAAYYNVKSFGAVGDGIADDTAEIQATIDATPAGGVVWFPPGTYLVSATIVIPGRITLMGGGGLSVGTTIKAAAGIADAVIASAAWYNNSTTCGNPVRIQGLEIDGSTLGTAVRGLVLTNFWSRVYDCQFRNLTGHGVELNDRTRNTTNVITNSASENSIVECRFASIGGNAIHQEASNQIANLDGRVERCFISSVDGYGIRIDRSAGWFVSDNHIYTIGLGAIRLGNYYATTCRGNYIEDFGGLDAAGVFYNGILMTGGLNGRASELNGNIVSTAQPASPVASRFTCFAVVAGSGQTRVNIAIGGGNYAHFSSGTAPTVKRSRAFELGAAAGGQLNVEWGSNAIENTPNWSDTRVVTQPAQVVLRGAHPGGVVTLTDGATVALDAAMGRVHKLVAAGDRTISAPLNPVEGQPLVIEHTASGAARTLTLTTGSAGAFAFGADVTGLTATASGMTDYIGAIYDATAARFRVVSYSKGYA